MSSTRSWRIERATAEDADALYKLLQEAFFLQEPVTKEFCQEHGIPPKSSLIAIRALSQDLSFKAVLPSGEIVGAVVNLTKMPQKPDRPASEFEKNLISFFNYVEAKSNGEEEGWLTLQVLAVHPSWRRQGIADELVDETVSEAVWMKCLGVRVMCTSFFTAKLVERKGWDQIYRLPYSDYRNAQGEPVIKTQPPHDAVTVYVKRNERLI